MCVPLVDNVSFFLQGAPGFPGPDGMRGKLGPGGGPGGAGPQGPGGSAGITVSGYIFNADAHKTHEKQSDI